MRCLKCNEYVKPTLFGSGANQIVLSPCGLVKGKDLQFAVVGCPMTEWMKGYADCLKDMVAEADKTISEIAEVLG